VHCAYKSQFSLKKFQSESGFAAFGEADLWKALIMCVTYTVPLYRCRMYFNKTCLIKMPTSSLYTALNFSQEGSGNQFMVVQPLCLRIIKRLLICSNLMCLMYWQSWITSEVEPILNVCIDNRFITSILDIVPLNSYETHACTCHTLPFCF
jgi:hypothetical protein